MNRREQRKLPSPLELVTSQGYEYTPEAAVIPAAVMAEADANPVLMPVVPSSSLLPPIPTLAVPGEEFRRWSPWTGRHTRRGEDERGTFRVSQLDRPPANCTGKVVVRYGQSAGHGSGAWIAPGVILTAAHVVEGQPTSVSFVPSLGSPADQPTVSAFPVLRSFTSRFYVTGPNSRNYAADVALLLLRPQYSDIGDYYGWLGADFSRAFRGRTLESYGYPADPPTRHQFDGRSLWMSRGDLRFTTSAGLLALPSEMTRGCSGGPWVEQAETDGPALVVSLNSHVRDFSEGIMYGPDLALVLPGMMSGVAEWVRQHNASRPDGSPDGGKWFPPRSQSSTPAAA